MENGGWPDDSLTAFWILLRQIFERIFFRSTTKNGNRKPNLLRNAQYLQEVLKTKSEELWCILFFETPCLWTLTFRDSRLQTSDCWDAVEAHLHPIYFSSYTTVTGTIVRILYRDDDGRGEYFHAWHSSVMRGLDDSLPEYPFCYVFWYHLSRWFSKKRYVNGRK